MVGVGVYPGGQGKGGESNLLSQYPSTQSLLYEALREVKSELVNGNKEVIFQYTAPIICPKSSILRKSPLEFFLNDIPLDEEQRSGLANIIRWRQGIELHPGKDWRYIILTRENDADYRSDIGGYYKGNDGVERVICVLDGEKKGVNYSILLMSILGDKKYLHILSEEVAHIKTENQNTGSANANITKLVRLLQAKITANDIKSIKNSPN